MRRFPAIILAAVISISGISHTAACAQTQAASPFEEVVQPEGRSSGHFWAYSSIVGGVGLVGLSFFVKDRADRRYDDYLAATDPAQIDRLYDETVRLDRWSTASLLTGQVLVALGVYLRFVKGPTRESASLSGRDAYPAPARLGLELEPTRWALSVKF